MAEPAPFRLGDFKVGHRFKQYQLLEQIGAGGQGVVWSALEPERERLVAIKFKEVAAEAATPQASDALFERQVAPLVSLRHAHVLPILDFGLAGPVQFLVSPFIPGGSLLERLRLGEIPVAEALRYAAQIASALGYLHAQGVVHRDLKPSNVLMDEARALYLADFGLARVVKDTTAALHTGHGTPPYAPPEQHTMDEITAQSDIFSFGVMLFELFTRQLPWNGKKTLGIQQLHTRDQIPDPRTVDPRLPAHLVLVLRLMTAASPGDRPKSVAEVMPMLEYAFKGVPMQAGEEQGVPAGQVQAAPQAGGEGDPRAEISTVALNLTRFALVEMKGSQVVEDVPTHDTARFMLYNALTFDYKHEYWWALVREPRTRLEVAEALMRLDDERVAARVLHHLLHDHELAAVPDPLPEALKSGILGLALGAENPLARRFALQALCALTPPGRTWGAATLESGREQALAAMALEDSPTGDQAARLVGHWRLRQAVETVARDAGRDRLVPALLEVQGKSGALPASLPPGVRLNVAFEWAWERFRARPLALLGAFLLTFLGAGLTFGLKEYLSVSAAGFLNSLNVVLSLERGALLGAPFALGVLVTRVIGERFPEVRAGRRAAAAALAGGAALSIAIFTYDVLVLMTVPAGFLYVAACGLVALGYALGALRPGRAWKIAASAVATCAAVGGSWWAYVNLAGSSYALSPVFFFKADWTAGQIAGAVLLFALGTSIPANLVDLSLAE